MIDVNKITFTDDELKRIRTGKLLPILFRQLPLEVQKRLGTV